MATVTEITGMCKAGRLADAYNAAKYDMTITPGNIWSQRGMWWALYYTIKADTEEGNLQDAFAHLDEVATLDLLRLEKDDLTYLISHTLLICEKGGATFSISLLI